MESLKIHWTYNTRALHYPGKAFPFGEGNEVMLRGLAKLWPTGLAADAKESDIDWAAYIKFERRDGTFKVAEYIVHMVSPIFRGWGCTLWYS